jgi:hypothetical protein
MGNRNIEVRVTMSWLWLVMHDMTNYKMHCRDMIFGTRGFSRAGNPNFEVSGHESCHDIPKTWFLFIDIKSFIKISISFCRSISFGLPTSRINRAVNPKVWSWPEIHLDRYKLDIRHYGFFGHGKSDYRDLETLVISWSWHFMHDMTNYKLRCKTWY